MEGAASLGGMSAELTALQRIATAISATAESTTAAPNSSSACCLGSSPLGVRWVYLQPQHTGTGAVVRFIQSIQASQPRPKHPKHPWKPGRVRVATWMCAHGHDDGCGRVSGAHVAFTFAANPFRRMHTSAVFHNVIPDDDNPPVALRERFRRWVTEELNNGTSSSRHVIPVSRFVQSARVNATYVGRTATLARDLRNVLGVLGYSLPEGSESEMPVHCISSCDEVDPSVRVGVAGAGKDRPVASPGQQVHFTGWYDALSATAVRRAYSEDFRQYGFSTDPRRMYDDLAVRGR